MALTALIAQVFRAPESLIAGPACFGLSQLRSHISTTEPKPAEDLKETQRCEYPRKAQKDRILQKIEDSTPFAMVVGTPS